MHSVSTSRKAGSAAAAASHRPPRGYDHKVSSSHPLDTSPAADRMQFERLRAMSPEERGAILTALTLTVQELALAGLRQRYPDATEDELWLRLAVRRLGSDVVQRVTGWTGGDS